LTKNTGYARIGLDFSGGYVMYSNTKTFATICIVVSGFNILVGALLLLYISSLDIPFGAYFSATTYIITTSAILLILSIALRKLADMLEYDFEDRVKKLKAIKDNIKELEITKK
jgi:hypothetical protein